jgi:t-SNARE complex subunit (syntaxin)
LPQVERSGVDVERGKGHLDNAVKNQTAAREEDEANTLSTVVLNLDYFIGFL